jgi:hypothetical protein
VIVVLLYVRMSDFSAAVHESDCNVVIHERVVVVLATSSVSVQK